MKLSDGLHYARRILDKSGPPIQLTYFVTSRCNLRCSHCFYWEALDADHSHELTLEEIERVARSLPRLLVLSLTGGEPFVRKDLADVHAAFCRHTRPHLVTISSNGHYQERMRDQLERMVTAFPDSNLYLYLSLDGPEAINDEIRGAGTYARTFDTLHLLQDLRRAHRNFGICINMCCHARNQDALPELLNELKGADLIDNISIGLVRGNAKDPAIKTVDVEKYRRLTGLKIEAVQQKDLVYFGFALKSLVLSKDQYTYETVAEVYEHDRWVLPCYAGSLMGILYDNGEVFPCEILPDASLGNVRDFDFDLAKLWSTPYAEATRRRIIDGHCYCTFECTMSSNVLFNPKYLAKSVLRATTGLS
jgi:MoaA/NifB/PqqE/SkfB family radical SAM enzyme